MQRYTSTNHPNMRLGRMAVSAHLTADEALRIVRASLGCEQVVPLGGAIQIGIDRRG